MAMTHYDNNDLSGLQERICTKYGADFSGHSGDMIVGLADNLDSSAKPLNGLRHPQSGTITGWYIWAGEYSSADNFFKPVHVSHVIQSHPEIAAYLALPPGWRFLIDPDRRYEDVWRDDSLLNV